MNYQLIPAIENERGLFVKTTKSFNHTGIVLMWLCMGLMCGAFLAESTMIRFTCFVAFALSYLFYMAAERNGGIFEIIVVQPNHLGRLLVFVVALLANTAGFIHLAIYGNTTVFILIALVTASAATAMRFVGLKN